MTQDPQDRPIDINVGGLTETQAYALAELCKRIGWSECRGNAVDDGEARNMLAAIGRVRSALQIAGVAVR